MKLSKVRLGVILLPYDVSFERLREAARRAESLGFDSLWIADHVQREHLQILECWSTISALAASTKRTRLGSLATCNSFRNPALLAKIVATVSEVSGGRVDLGIGMGYDEAEHEGYGFPFPPFAERVDRLAEALELVRRLWSEESVTFRGNHFRLNGGVCLPRPKEAPRVWVAGRSENILEAAARGRAYGANIVPYSGTMDGRRLSTSAELDQLVERVDSKGLRKSMYCGDGGAIIAKDARALDRRLAEEAKRRGISRSEAAGRVENLSSVHGTVDECEKKLELLASMGFEELMLIFPGWQQGDYRNMDLFAHEFVR